MFIETKTVLDTKKTHSLIVTLYLAIIGSATLKGPGSGVRRQQNIDLNKTTFSFRRRR